MRARIQKIDRMWVTTLSKYDRSWSFANFTFEGAKAELPFLFIVLTHE